MPRNKYTWREQMLSTKTVANIARQVHEEETPKIIHRMYLFGKYDAVFNLWEQLGDADTSLIDWSTNAKIVDVCAIKKLDVATENIATSGGNIPDNELTARNELQQSVLDNPNLLHFRAGLNNGRISDKIKIHGLSALVRLTISRIGDTEYTDKVTFRFGFYKCTKIGADGTLDNTYQPDIKSLVKWKPFGYSAQLDNIATAVGTYQSQGQPYATENLNMLLNSEKIQTLAEREVTMHLSSTNNVINQKVIRMYQKINIEDLQYNPTKIVGNQPNTLNYRIFFAIRADTPYEVTDVIQPRAVACVKVHYSNVM